MSVPVRSALAFAASLDLNQHDLVELVLENLSAAPADPEDGRKYFDTTLHTERTWDGTQWMDNFHPSVTFGNVTAQTSFGASSSSGSSDNSAKADHTHGTPAHNDAAHSSIHLNALAAPSANLNLNGKRITNGADPVDDTDFATKQYVTYNSYGLDVHASVDLVLTTETLFSAPPSGEMVIDGTLTNASRVLVAQPHPEGDPSTLYNGVWITDAAGWTRADDGDDAGEIIHGSAFYISGGKSRKGELWACYGLSDTTWTPDEDAAYFTQISSLSSSQAGVGLSRTGNTLNVITDDDSGIDLSSGVVRADFGLVVRKLATTVGNGSATSFTVDCTSIGGPADAIVQVKDLVTGQRIIVDISDDGTQNVTVGPFATAPSADSIRILIKN